MYNCVLPLGPDGHSPAQAYHMLAQYVSRFGIAPHKIELSHADSDFLGSDSEQEAAFEEVEYYYDDPRVINSYEFLIELTELDAQRLVHRGRSDGKRYFQVLYKDRALLMFEDLAHDSISEDQDEWSPLLLSLKVNSTSPRFELIDNE